MKRISLLSIIVLLFTALSGRGQTVALATWDFSGLPAGTGNSTLAPTTTNSAVTIGALTRGSGLTANFTLPAGSAYWGANGFFDGVAFLSQTKATAITNSNFFTFTVTPNAGTTMSFTRIDSFNVRKGANSAPNSFIWQYSLDGTNFNDIGSTITTGTLTTAAGNPKDTVSLSSITDLQNIASGTTVTFRLVAWSSSADAGAFLFNGGGQRPALTFRGTVTSGPLPLELLSFKGKVQSGVNHLDWITAHESNVSHFDVERGADGRTFTKIAEVKAKGNSAAGSQYSIDDAHAPAVAYYRLKMTDADGKYRYSDVVTLRSGMTGSAVSVYPNPSAGTLFLTGLQGKTTYCIVNAAGVTVLAPVSVTASGNVAMINVAALPAGIYFVNYKDENNAGTLRFVKK